MLIVGHSTEGRQMAGCSVDTAVVDRDNQSGNLLFAVGQAFGSVINGLLKVMEQTGHLRCHAGQANGIGSAARRSVARAVV